MPGVPSRAAIYPNDTVATKSANKAVTARKRASRRYTIPLIVALLFICIELFGFNMPHWQSLNAEPQMSNAGTLGSGLTWVGTNQVKVVSTKDESWQISSKQPIQYFYINSSKAEAGVKILAWNMDTRKATDGDWYTGQGGERYSPKYDNSRFIHVDDGSTHLRFRYQAPKGAIFPISTLTFNPRVPLRFPLVRIALETFLALLIIVFRPGSELYRRRFSLRDPICDIGLLAVLGAQIGVLVFLWYAWGGGQITDDQYKVSTSSIWGGHQYQQLADALIHGHLDLGLPVNSDLQQMHNPYDALTRLNLPKGDAPIYFDTAFYNGKYYSYFGVLPALLAFIPYKLITGADLSSTAAILAFDIILAVASTLVLVQLTRLMARRTHAISVGAVLLVDEAFLMGLPALYILHSEKFYQLPQTLSVVLTLLALSCWVESKLRKLSKAWLAAGSLMMALTLASRPQLILASVLALPLFWREIKDMYREARHSRHGLLRMIWTWVCALLPFVIVFIPTLTYNYFRFGSFTDFGANYNLTGFDMPHYRMPWSQVLSLAFAYLFQPPNMTMGFPFFRSTGVQFPTWMAFQPSLGGYFTVVAPFALSAFALFGYRKRLRHLHLTAMSLWLTAIVLVLFVVDSHWVGYDSRYILDFGWAIMLLFAILVCLIDTRRQSANDHGSSLRIVSENGHTSHVRLPLLKASSSRAIGWILVGVVLAWLFAFFNIFGATPTQYNESLWWNVSSWFLFV